MAQKEFLSFEINLFKGVNKTEQVISPYSTGVCLAYLANLVNFEETRNDLIKLLHSSQKKYWSYFEMILKMNTKIANEPSIKTANILFCEKKQTTSTFFLEQSNSENELTSRITNYMPEMVSINTFLDSVPSVINKTIRKRTGGLITHVMNPQMSRSFRNYVVMSSILTFEGHFATPFQIQEMHQFHCFLKNFQNVHNENQNNYHTHHNCACNSNPIKRDKNMTLMLIMQNQKIYTSKAHRMKMILIPFEGDRISFIAIMPKKKGEPYFKRMIRKLNTKRFLDLVHRKVLKRTDLMIPAINIETDSSNCFDQIKTIGINQDSFDLDSNEKLTHFRQKCVFSLNKYGTVQNDNSFEVNEKDHTKQVSVKFNRPFIYFIFNHNPEVILLSGTYTKC